MSTLTNGTNPNTLPDKVLILSDDKNTAILCDERLRQEKFNCEWVTTFAKAAPMITENEYQALIIEFKLSDTTAINVLHYVKERSSNTIVIIIAEEIDENLLLKAMQAGASYCIPKIYGYAEQLPYLIKLSTEQQIAFKTAANLAANKKSSSQSGISSIVEYKGKLSTTTVPRLMRIFYQQQLTGALHISRDGVVTSFYFIDGAIAYVGSAESETLLGEKLVEQGKISQLDLDAVSKYMSNSSARFSKAITTLGLMRLEELKPILVKHVLKQLYSSFEWVEGEFVFERGTKLENEVMLSLSTADVIFAGIRHLKNRSLIENWLGDYNRVLIPTSDLMLLFQALTLHPEEIKVIEKISKPMPINEISKIDGLNEEVVLRTLCGLVETGMLVPFEAKAERLLVEMSKFSELFEVAPLPPDFDAQAAAEFCYEIETLLHKFGFCDHYAVLDVGRKSSKQQITEAFREIAKRFHPDRHSQLASYHLNLKADLKAIFERVAQAYYTLTDDERRANYDLTLRSFSTAAKSTNNFVDNKVNVVPDPSLAGTKPLPPVIPGLPGSDEYMVALDFYRKRDFNQARLLLLEAIAEDPENAEYQVALARSMLKLPDYIPRAEDAYLRAIELSPRNAEYCAELGLFYQRFSQTTQARAMFRRTLEIDPNNPIALRVNT